MGYTLITNSIGYINSIDAEIKSLKERGLKYFFRMNQRLHRDVLSEVRNYCVKNNYRYVINPCKKMVNAYEIIIMFEETLDKNKTV